MCFLHLHVKLLIKNHESFNLKIYANGCFVVSVKQVTTVPAKQTLTVNLRNVLNQTYDQAFFLFKIFYGGAAGVRSQERQIENQGEKLGRAWFKDIYFYCQWYIQTVFWVLLLYLTISHIPPRSVISGLQGFKKLQPEYTVTSQFIQYMYS